ncbi:hypothetical protein MKUB_41200 [Mycobacterium kubicae]|uniref:Uncharacterized protein n=1 Tax=Mycobacterium kubicae TaxID=120959 RepID=A0ABQ1BSC6_9MYCO|nr:hypothetical protein MKUB_41200 [Mycobacterium kubicae]
MRKLSEAAGRGGDALVSGGQRNPHMLCTARAVELAGRHQDAARGQPRMLSRHGSPRVAHK